MKYYNPYSGQDFFGFFYQLFFRLWNFITGGLSLEELASDEIQILVLIGVAASAALLGSFLVLRKMAMLANALSHTILLGIAAAYALAMGFSASFMDHRDPVAIASLMQAALAMGILTTFLTEFLNKNAGLQEDASIGLVFSTLFAAGIVVVTMLTRSAHIGTEVVMGNVDALELGDLKLVYITLGINIIVIFMLFKEFKITTFDPGLSRVLGISPTFYNYLLMSLVSAAAIAAFRAVGVLMVLSFITGPPLTARLLTHHLTRMLFIAIAIGIGASVLGVALSRAILSVYGMALSTAGIIVVLIMLLFACLFTLKKSFELIKRSSVKKLLSCRK